MDFRVLGPLEVLAAGRIVDVASPNSALLARLLMSHGKVVPVDDLVAALWGEESPTSARNSLQSHVSRLRDALRPAGASIEAGPVGYRLAVPDAAVDAVRFEQLLEAARREPGAAPSVGLFDEALARVARSAYAEFADDFARPEAVRLEELRVTAREPRRGAAHHGPAGAQEAVAALEALAAEHPLRSARRRCSCARCIGSAATPRRCRSFGRTANAWTTSSVSNPPRRCERCSRRCCDRHSTQARSGTHADAGTSRCAACRAHAGSAHVVRRPRRRTRGRRRGWPGHASSACSARAAPGKHGWPLEVAQHHGDTFSGGVEWVGLAAVRDEGARRTPSLMHSGFRIWGRAQSRTA